MEAKKMVESGIRDSGELIEHAHQIISREKLARIEYIKVCSTDTLEDIRVVSEEAVMALAVHFGSARLIDNIKLEAP